jgi:hypothetical protein
VQALCWLRQVAAIEEAGSSSPVFSNQTKAVPNSHWLLGTGLGTSESVWASSSSKANPPMVR